MKSEQLEQLLISEVSARQVVDSTRAFKEYVRVRKELRELGGSLRWKSVKGYEYLVQRAGHRLFYLGKRSAETEQKHDEHSTKKERLETRFESLAAIVEMSQRMNKAVHAGVVPTELMAVLLKLDDLELAGRSILLGAPALYAYGQSSGLRIDAIRTPVTRESVVAEAARNIHIFIEDLDSASAIPFHRFIAAMRRLASVEQAKVEYGETSGVVLDIIFYSPKKTAPEEVSKKHIQRLHQRSAGPEKPWLDIIGTMPKYEQVVIGKSGKMAVMRTVDPLLFTMGFECTRTLDPTSTTKPELVAFQVELVKTMLKEHMVNSRIDPVQREHLEMRLSQDFPGRPTFPGVTGGG